MLIFGDWDELQPIQVAARTPSVQYRGANSNAAGYSLPTPEMVEAVKLMAKTKGILMDRVLFVHTGGSPALHAYAGIFTK